MGPAASSKSEPWRARPLPLLVLLVTHIVVPSVGVGREIGHARTLLMAIVFGFATFSIARGPRLRILSVALLMLAYVARVSVWADPSRNTLLFAQGTTLAFLLFTAVALATVVNGREHRVAERILAAVTAYLLLGFVWADAYSIVDLLHPGAIHFPEADVLDETAAERLGAHRFIYFSFITMTTVGYGDAVPLLPFARSLAVLEALSGQLFLAITVARLVGAPSEEKDTKKDPKNGETKDEKTEA
jgi:hypothetical protein